MRYFTLLIVGLVVGITAMMAWTDKRLQHYEQIARDAEAATSIAQANYAEKVLALKTDTIRVVKWATRYDTIRAELDSIAPITDTVTTVPAYWVRGLVLASDSTIAACRELVGSSGRALTACDSVQIALGRERDAFKKLYETAKPSKWDKARPWLALGLGFYVGAKLRVP